jgi:hypothetical protein
MRAINSPFRALFGFVAATGIVGIVLFYIAMVVGWGMNLYKTIELIVHNSPVTAMFVARIVGVFIGWIGAILGYF